MESVSQGPDVGVSGREPLHKTTAPETPGEKTLPRQEETDAYSGMPYLRGRSQQPNQRNILKLETPEPQSSSRACKGLQKAPRPGAVVGGDTCRGLTFPGLHSTWVG